MDKLKEIWKVIYDKLYKLSSKFDGISEQIFEKTGVKINIGAIVIGIMLVIFVILVVKGILGFVFNALATGEY